MIVLKTLSIVNFRSIIKTPLEIDFENYTAFVGENNSGKSNILRALNIFFNDKVDDLPFDPQVDFPKNTIDISAGAQTKIIVTISYDPEKDTKIKNAINEIERNTDQKKLENNLLRLRLSYSKRGNETWQFIGRKGSRNIKKDLTDKIVSALRTSVKFKYLPVGRNITQLIENELTEELLQTLFGGYSGAVEYRRHINEAIQNLVDALTPKLGEGSLGITDSMKLVFTNIEKFGLELPFNSLETLISNLDINITDNYQTDIKNKGAGMQTSSLLFLMKYIADNYPQRHNARKTYIWGIEEPESFLHPAKQREMAKVIRTFSEETQTIITTHNGHFIPRETASVYVISKKETAPYQTVILDQNWETAKNVLGVSILDSLRLWPINIVVEGPSDEIIFKKYLELAFKLNPEKYINPEAVRFHPAGNCINACSMFEMYYQETKNSDIECYLIVDGDDAGRKAINGMLRRGQHEGIKYKNNSDYFILGSDIELLFNDTFLNSLQEDMPRTVTLIKDVEDKIIDVKITDGNKIRVAKKIIEKANLNDFHRMKRIFQKMSAVYTEDAV